MKGKIIFEEEQSFVGTWMWYLVIGISALSIGGTGLGLYFSRDNEGVIGLLIAAFVTLGIVVLFYNSKLILVIDKDAIYYKFPPFVKGEKIVGKEEVKKVYIRKYNSLSEYGGWGYRYSFKNGRALNIIGGVGLQIVANNGKKILIGTQKPDLLERSIRQLKDNWGMNNGK
jgi:hypothetical protein